MAPKLLRSLGLAAALAGVAGVAPAIVNYDAGQRQIAGVQLLQDLEDPNAYYYIPPFPRLSTRDDGSYELLCLKFVDRVGGTNGGLLHALVELSLPEEAVRNLGRELARQVPGARIVGPVPLMQAGKDGEPGMGSFELVSAVLSDRAEGGFTRSVVTSGKAPLAPGSKAVLAATLSQQGATLLWSSFDGPTSDVSVAVHAYYEAAVKGYNAVVHAEMNTVYEHASRVMSNQQGYSKRQVRDVVDELVRTGGLTVEVFDRSVSTGIKAEELDAVLSVVTDKLTELMFDHTAGWAADPEREAAVEEGQLLGRQERSWLARTFGSRDDTPYYTDDQYVLKNRSDVRQNSFTLNLAKRGTIKVPVGTAGNLGGVYRALKDDGRYFRIVSLADDAAFEQRVVHFQIDGAYLDAFEDTINFVAVNVRKARPGHSTFTAALHFTGEDVQKGRTLQSISIPRLGAQSDDYTEYEYQVRWSLRDLPVMAVPTSESAWVRSRDSVVALTPPFEKTVIEVDADRRLFSSSEISTGVVEVFSLLGGRPRIEQLAVLRAEDAESTVRAAVYHDRGTPLAARQLWHSPTRSATGELEELTSTYLYLVPPKPPSPSPEVP